MKIKLAPAVRFPGFTDVWEQRKLEELAESFNYGLNASAMEFDGENKYIRITDIDEQSHKFIQSGLTSPNIDLLNADDYLLKEGDILFARTGASVGKSYQYEPLDGKVYFAGFLIRARIKPEFDPSFIFQNTLTEKYNNFIKVTSQRSGQPGVNAQEYANFSILIPSRGEQVKLGNFFKQLDDTIALHQRELDNLKITKQVFMKKMFPKEGEKVPEVRFPGFMADWDYRKLGDVGETYTGLSGKSKDDFGHGRGKYVTYMNVFSNSIANPSLVELVEIDTKQNEVNPGDIFFTTSSETPEEVGMSSVWLENSDNTYLNSFCFGYRPIEKFDNYYLAYMLRSSVVRKKITFLAQGISRYNISKNKVMDIAVPIPVIEEQTKIGEFFKQLDDIINLQQQELEKLKQTKQAFLQKMFI